MGDSDHSVIDEFRLQVMEYIDAYNSGDNNRLCACYASDAWAFFPETDIIVVPEVASAVLNRLERSGAIANLYHQLLEMDVIGDEFGFSAGVFTAVDPEGRATGRYKDMLFWKKVDGKWLIYRQIWNFRVII